MRSSQSGAPIMLNVDHVTRFIRLYMKMIAMLKLKGAFVIFFFLGNYNYASFGTFNYIPEKNEKDGKRRGSRILNTCVGTVLL